MIFEQISVEIFFTVLLIISPIYYGSGQCHIMIAEGIASEFTSSHGCVCPGDHLTFECSVQGGVATVWEGSAFDCGVDASSSFIRLRHSGFSMLEPARGECNNGLIVARSVGVLNDTFSSQLDVNVTADMNNKTIECALDATGSGDYKEVGMITIIVATGK